MTVAPPLHTIAHLQPVAPRLTHLTAHLFRCRRRPNPIRNGDHRRTRCPALRPSQLVSIPTQGSTARPKCRRGGLRGFRLRRGVDASASVHVAVNVKVWFHVAVDIEVLMSRPKESNKHTCIYASRCPSPNAHIHDRSAGTSAASRSAQIPSTPNPCTCNSNPTHLSKNTNSFTRFYPLPPVM